MYKEKEAHKQRTVDSAFFDTHKKPFRLSRFIHNKKEGTYLGRTPDSWGKNHFRENLLCVLPKKKYARERRRRS